jgi:hypothetical protein
MNIMRVIIIVLTLAIVATWFIPVEANDDVKNTLIDSGVAHIYIHNRTDGIADRITVFDAEGLAVACSISGVTTVSFQGADHTCEPI